VHSVSYANGSIGLHKDAKDSSVRWMLQAACWGSQRLLQTYKDW